MARKNSKHIKKKNSKKHYNKSYKKMAFVVVLILIIILILNLKNTPAKIKNEKTQIIINNENITSNLQDEIIIEKEKIYMSFNDIQKFLDKTIYQEEETGLIITSSNKKIATIKQGEESIKINGSDQKIKDILVEQNGQKYIAISELEDVYDYSFNYISGSNIVTIDNLNKKSVKAYAKKKLKIKKEEKEFSKILEIVDKGKWVVFIGEENGYAKVRTQNGVIGYVKKNTLDNFVTEREDFEEVSNEIFDGEKLEYDITKKDISNFEKRSNIINLILQEAIKNDKMYVEIIYNGEDNSEFERFKIEIAPVLQECGIKINI